MKEDPKRGIGVIWWLESPTVVDNVVIHHTLKPRYQALSSDSESQIFIRGCHQYIMKHIEIN